MKLYRSNIETVLDQLDKACGRKNQYLWVEETGGCITFSVQDERGCLHQGSVFEATDKTSLPRFKTEFVLTGVKK